MAPPKINISALGQAKFSGPRRCCMNEIRWTTVCERPQSHVSTSELPAVTRQHVRAASSHTSARQSCQQSHVSTSELPAVTRQHVRAASSHTSARQSCQQSHVSTSELPAVTRQHVRAACSQSLRVCFITPLSMGSFFSKVSKAAPRCSTALTKSPNRSVPSLRM